MNFEKEEVLKLANLARITLTDQEAARMRETLGDILEYVEKLGEVDTSAVADTESGLESRTRHDEIENCDEKTVSRILSQFPDRENDSLVVPGVFDEPKG